MLLKQKKTYKNTGNFNIKFKLYNNNEMVCEGIEYSEGMFEYLWNLKSKINK